jgi:hypothetical protein
MHSFDEEIARRLQEAADSGELQGAKGYGKPTPDDPAWDATPEALRMPIKILRDAGAAPPEIAMFHERAQLKVQIATATDPGERQKLQLRLVGLEAIIALRLEALRTNGNL